MHLEELSARILALFRPAKIPISPVPPTPPTGMVYLYAEDANGVARLRVVHSTGSNLALFRDSVLRIRNTSGGTINKGEAVYFTGATGNTPTVSKARANSVTTMPSIGLLTSTVTNGSFGTVQFFGELTGLDTSAFAEGDKLWLSASTAGALTNVEQLHPNFSQPIGIVTKSNAGDGRIHLYTTLTHEGDDSGTNRNEFHIGDTTAGNKDLVYHASVTGTLRWSPTTANRTITLPDTSGTVALVEDVEALARTFFSFGAVGDGVADDTSALNDAFQWLRDYPVTDPPLMRPLRLVGQGGIFRCTGSVDATGINLGRTWEVDCLNIVSEATGKTALDLTGIRFGHLRNVRVWGDQTDQPHAGILLARNAGTCSDNVFDNVSTDGYFTAAGFLMYAAEVNQFNHCHFWNRRVADGSGEAWAAILQGSDYKTMVSDFQTLSTGRQSFTVNQFNQCMFQKPFGIAGATVLMTDIASVSFNGCYVTNGSGSAFVWLLTGTFVPYRVYMDFQQETTGTDRFILFTSDAAAAREVRGLHITFGNSYCQSEIFEASTLTGLTLNNFKCHLYRMATGVTLANKMFASGLAAVTTIHDADIVVPALTDFNGPAAFASITGKAMSLDGGLMLSLDGGVATLTDADATLTPAVSKTSERLAAALTNNRTLTLSTTGAYAGCEFSVTRLASSTGAFTLSVGGLKSLATGQWCTVIYNGSAWELKSFGSL